MPEKNITEYSRVDYQFLILPLRQSPAVERFSETDLMESMFGEFASRTLGQNALLIGEPYRVKAPDGVSEVESGWGWWTAMFAVLLDPAGS